MAKERVQKILAKAGIASRRSAEDLIREGQVTINGKLAKLGDQAEIGTDSIKVAGKLIHKQEPLVYLAFFKPRNVISMVGDPQGRPSLADYISRIKTRIFPIGRLDFTSEGLILLTNDGVFAEKLSKRDDIPRVYHVKVKGHPDPEMLRRLERGVRPDRGKKIKPHSIRVEHDLTSKTRIEVVFLESGVMDVRALFENTGFLFERITRTAIGHVTLKGMKPGEFRYLNASQAEALLEQPELGMRMLENLKNEEISETELRELREARLQKKGMRPELDAGVAADHARSTEKPKRIPFSQGTGDRRNSRPAKSFAPDASAKTTPRFKPAGSMQDFRGFKKDRPAGERSERKDFSSRVRPKMDSRRPKR
jgi:pseudouridine synthase